MGGLRKNWKEWRCLPINPDIESVFDIYLFDEQILASNGLLIEGKNWPLDLSCLRSPYVFIFSLILDVQSWDAKRSKKEIGQLLQAFGEGLVQ